MKRWTVMLIPHGRGDTASFGMSAWHLWAVVTVILGLSFLSGFLYQRNRVAAETAAEIARQYQNLEMTMRHQPKLPQAAHSNRGGEMNPSLRKKYEKRDAALLAELSRLYDLEAEVRNSTGLPPRDAEPAALGDSEGGKGGGPAELGAVIEYSNDELLRPPQVIYGLSRPSADLIMQEIQLRKESLRQLLAALTRQEDRVARLPSVWPTTHDSRTISSRFGNRRDPFSNRLRHHGGVDFAADHGTQVLSTAKGTVSHAGWADYYGYIVKIDHGNGIETWYAHLSEVLVDKGEQVTRHTPVGKVGSTGRSTGAHIHYEVHVDGKRVDPAKYFPH